MRRHPPDRGSSPLAAQCRPAQAPAASTGLPGSRQSAARPQVPLHASALGWAFAALPTATVITDDRRHIVAANAAYERLTGQRQSAWMGAPLPVEEMPHDAACQQGSSEDRTADAPREVIVRCADDSRHRVWLSWASLPAPNGAARLHVATLSELGRWDGEFELWRHRARHDALTGLPNRAHLEAELERGLARAARHQHRLAVLFIDLDGFKPINDGHGHAAGDRVLARVGLRLRDALRAEDFVARYGGDEFVILIEAPRHVADAAAAAQTVLAALSRDHAVPGDAGSSVSASIGIALYPDHAGDAARLLQVADEAMYQAKRSGGRSVAVATAAGLTETPPLPHEAA